jgi:dipeptidyl aminopeptidase/acylaminoacyl peptidase
MPNRKKRFLSADDLYKIEIPATPRISPDGSAVVYAVPRIGRKTEEKYSNLWIVPTAGGSASQYTFGDQSDSMPKWSPDGEQIAFLSNRGDREKPGQIYLIPFRGGEARPLTSIKGSILYFSFSPNGKQIICVIRKTDPEVLEREEDEQKKKLGVVERHYNRLFYKLDGFGYLPKERAHLWVVDTKSGRAKQITDHELFDEADPVWSPDGKWLAFVSNRSPDPDSKPDAIDLFVLPASGGDLRKIEAPVGVKSHPSFSPDGNWIAYYGVDGEDLWYKNTSLWVVPADGSAPPQNLTEKYDLHTSSWTINDLGQPEQVAPIWSRDGKTIYFPAVCHGSSVLYSISIDGVEFQPVIGEGGVAGSFSFDQDQHLLAFSYGRMDDPGQIYLQDMVSSEKRPLTSHNKDLFASVESSVVEEAWIKGPDGNDIQGWILKPPGFDPSKKYPSILEIHGGPLTQYGNYFMHEFYFLAAQGYVVHFSNPRGGRGYGEEHAKAIWGGWGGADYADLMAWTDYVAQQSYIDPERMGVGGGSYGGYMTLWIIGHTHRFKAAVTMRCVSNLVSLWGSSDLNWTFQQDLSNKPPFEDLQKFWDHSPIKYIGNAKTPTLVIHNEMDLRCPIEQGEQVFVALKRLGVDSEMVRFPEEFHGLSRSGRTDRRIARLNHILRWFDKYLKD